MILLSDGAQRAYASARRAAADGRRAAEARSATRCTPSASASRAGWARPRTWPSPNCWPNQSVFVKNELTVGGQIRVDGYADREIPVQLLFETAPGKMEAVDREEVRGHDRRPAARRSSSATCPQSAGEYQAHARSRRPAGRTGHHQQPAEHVRQRAQGRAERALPGGLSAPGRAEVPPPGAGRLARHQRRLSCASTPARPRPGPADLAERFEPGKYEVYILGDSTRRPSRDDELAELAETVATAPG